MLAFEEGQHLNKAIMSMTQVMTLPLLSDASSQLTCIFLQVKDLITCSPKVLAFQSMIDSLPQKAQGNSHCKPSMVQSCSVWLCSSTECQSRNWVSRSCFNSSASSWPQSRHNLSTHSSACSWLASPLLRPRLLTRSQHTETSEWPNLLHLAKVQ